MELKRVKKKLVVVGDGGCGKTCLLNVFCQKGFLTEHIPTVFETDVADIQAGDKMVEMSLWDTAGQEDYDRLRPFSYAETNVLLICFSISNPDSFSNITEKWLPEVREFCPKIPYILVGTKNDLKTDPYTLQKLEMTRQKPITLEEGQDMADQVKAVAYLECSAKTNTGVTEVFETAAFSTLKKKKPNSFCKIL